MKRLLCVTLLAVFFALSAPEASSAQANVFLGGGATIPVSDYGELANTGWQGWGGVLIPVGAGRFSFGVEGFYGSNNHETDGNNTKVLGGLGLVGVQWGDPDGVWPAVFGGLGFMNRKFTSESLPAIDNSSSSLAWGGGAGVGFPIGGVGGFVGGSYTSGTGDVNFATRFLTFGLSVMIPVG